MPDVDKFSGFDPPDENWSKLPNELIEAFPLIETESELKIILYVLRHTWGFQEFDQLKRITLDEFRNGRKKRDGTRFDSGTGLSKNAIKDGIRRAIEHGFLIQEPDGRDAARSSHTYQLRVSNSDPVKVCPSGGQSLTPCVSNSDPRSEKETKKETKKERGSSSSFSGKRRTLEQTYAHCIEH